VRDLQRVPLQAAGIEWLHLDLEQPEQIRALASDMTHRVEGRLDCLVNNAGFGLLGSLASYSDAQMRRQMEVNFFGPAILTRELLPALIAARGRIINLSSMLGETGMPLNALYCASKHALEGLSRALRHELAPRCVQVAIVAPGGFRTRFGNNVQWGERDVTHDPVSTLQTTNLRTRLEARMRSRPGADPQRVVQTVVRLAERRRMPPVTRVGGDARLIHALYRGLPGSWAEALLGAVYGRILLKPVVGAGSNGDG
jgi:NAD(P)-dependent dehydrogenase (short-subunit alcohol dehydrogenase family)